MEAAAEEEEEASVTTCRTFRSDQSAFLFFLLAGSCNAGNDDGVVDSIGLEVANGC